MSGCIIQCWWRFGQQEVGHGITGRGQQSNARPSKIQRAEVHSLKQQLCISVWKLGETLCNRLKLPVNPRSSGAAASWKLQLRGKKKSKSWCVTPAGSRWSAAEQILLLLTHKVSTFYFYCCHVQSGLLRIGSPPRPPFSSFPTPSLHLHPSLRAAIVSPPPPPPPTTQRGPPRDVNHAVN